MRIVAPITVDFETEKILPRPEYPPKPVGVSIIEVGKRPRYYAWGHPTENNCTLAEARKLIHRIWKAPNPKLFHHGKFDMDVAETFFNVPPLGWSEFHDTMFLAFLDNPHNEKLGLKPLGEEYLEMPPEEQDELTDWILTNLRTTEKSGNGSVVHVRDNVPFKTYKIPPTKAGGFIAYTPAKLAGRYANGDTHRTRKLFDLWSKTVLQDDKLSEAYDRERQLVRPLLEQERVGVRIHEKRLRDSTKKWKRDVEKVEKYLRKKLKKSNLDFDKSAELADALEDIGAVEEWIVTDSGNRSLSKDNLKEVLLDKEIANLLDYRSSVLFTLRNFGEKWLEVAGKADGYIFTNWNQVRQTKDHRSTKGARTGRLSTNPNFQNMPKIPIILVFAKAIAKQLEAQKEDFMLLPRSLEGIELPNIRDFIIPDSSSDVLLNRDYSQQELRILGHFEDGVLLKAYNENPHMDIHDYARDIINELLNANFPRKPIKNIGFGLIYGMGILLLALMSKTDKQTAKLLKETYLDIFPGLRDLDDDLKFRGKNDIPITTWGGRKYFVEPPKFIKGQLRTFEYKLLNILIQGSAADCTKQAVINYHNTKKHGRFLLTVHDELMVNVDKKHAKTEMAILREAMESVSFDLPMLSDGKWSAKSWAQLKKFKEPKWEALQ